MYDGNIKLDVRVIVFKCVDYIQLPFPVATLYKT
jgi:hypothetical protein